jgi:hypothetical protein
MKLHILLTLIVLLLSGSSAIAKDDITKELITSNGKTTCVLSLRALDHKDGNSGPADNHAPWIEPHWRNTR